MAVTQVDIDRQVFNLPASNDGRNTIGALVYGLQQFRSFNGNLNVEYIPNPASAEYTRQVSGQKLFHILGEKYNIDGAFRNHLHDTCEWYANSLLEALV